MIPVRVSLFFLFMAIGAGLLGKHFPEPLIDNITPAVMFLAVIALTTISFFMLLPKLKISRILQKTLHG